MQEILNILTDIDSPSHRTKVFNWWCSNGSIDLPKAEELNIPKILSKGFKLIGVPRLRGFSSKEQCNEYEWWFVREVDAIPQEL